MELTIRLTAEPLPNLHDKNSSRVRELSAKVKRVIHKVTIDRATPLVNYSLENCVKGLLSEEDLKSLVFSRFALTNRKTVDLSKSFNENIMSDSAKEIFTAEFLVK
jgi:hypothetical protein